MTIFNDLEKPQQLILRNSKQYNCGIVLQCYEPKRGEQAQTA
jgi:hypothetical protein